jgi:glycosyltransferase involved in cell wall biosynthesis
VSPRSGVEPTEFGVLHRVRSPFRPVRQVMVPGHAPFVAAGVARFLREWRGPVLIHGFGIWGHVGLTVGRRLSRTGVEVVPIASCYTTYEHESRGKLQGLGPSHGLRHRLRYRAEHLWISLVVGRYARRAYTGSRLVLINYESVRRLLAAQYGDGVRSRMVPYAPESAFLLETPGRPAAPAAPAPPGLVRAPVIVAISRHDPRKGVDILLRALARLCAEGVAFRAHVVGGGRLLADHRRLAVALGLGETTLLTGQVPDTSVYLREADVFVLPSLQEGSGSVALLEAFQAGRAVVASRCDGIPEDVIDGENGRLVPPGDPVALAEVLRSVLADPSGRQALGQGARRTFVRRFAADALVDALQGTYTGLGIPPASPSVRARPAAVDAAPAGPGPRP